MLSKKLYKDDADRKAAVENDDIRVVAVDLQEMAEVEGVAILQGDITTEETMLRILKIFKDKPTDLVVCDGAPDLTGLHEIDQYLQAQLLQAALTTATKCLREGGTFVAKFFKMSDLSYLHNMMKQIFKDVYVVNPESSRS